MNISILNQKFNVRQMQAYAALCLRQFCENWAIRHEFINELVLHLMQIMTAQDLSEWEQRGAVLKITGRGDPLPIGVIDNIPTDILDDFNNFVELCVEVGIVDMYGASTEQPLNFLEKCIDILKRNNIEFPDPNLIIKYGCGGNGWGEAIGDTEINDIFKQYGIK